MLNVDSYIHFTGPHPRQPIALTATMLLDSPGYPHIPTFELEPTYSFYPYPISSRSHVHQILLKPSPHAAKPQASHPTPANNGLSGVSFVPQPVMAISGPGPSTQMIRSQEKSKARAQRRALMGKRPAGIDLSRHADELSEEEDAMEDEKVGQSVYHSESVESLLTL